MIERKKSRQRDAIYDFLASTKAHPDASLIYDEVRKSIPNISLGTVYRNLSLMADERRILKLTGEGGSVHYDANLYPHNHAICRKCGKIEDIFKELNSDIKSLANCLDGYEVEDYSLVFYGTCKECTKENY